MSVNETRDGRSVRQIRPPKKNLRRRHCALLQEREGEREREREGEREREICVKERDVYETEREICMNEREREREREGKRRERVVCRCQE